jgi:hypothetical protein
LANRAPRSARIAQRRYPLLAHDCPWAIDPLSLTACIAQPGFATLNDQAALQFGNGAENGEKSSCRWEC